tara:strand:+ start:10699 stop:11001 length:303 start_codon:yes stop_codon:yes gene_type:complete
MPLRIEKIGIKVKSGRKIYKPIKYPEISPSIDDIYVITTVNDRLDLLANQFYNNVDYWWVIANANPSIIKRDSFLLKPGLEIRIPQNIAKIFQDFERENK